MILLLLILNIRWIVIGVSVILFTNNIIILIIIFVVGSILNFSTYYLAMDVAVGVFNIVYITFIIGMILLLTSYYLVMFVRWERIRLISMLLISYWRRPSGISGAISAIMYNRWGDYFFIIFYIVTGSEVILCIRILSILSKSSIYLYSYWLPIAMERPTPVSSLLHSSTIVVARVYLSIILNLKIILIIIVLLVSYFLYNQIDVKKNIAMSTSLHLTLILLLVIIDIISYVLVYILLHGIIKGQLFQLSGYTLHTVGMQDIRKYSGVMIVILIFLAIWLLTAMAGIGIVGIKELLIFSLESLLVIIIMLISLYYTVIFINKIGSIIMKGEMLSIYVIVVSIISIVIIEINIVLWLFVLVIIVVIKVIAKRQFSTVL